MDKTGSRLLVVLLALASLGTTVLIGLTVLRGSDHPPTPASGSALPQTYDPVFSQGLAMLPFTLTERSGRPFASSDLQGKIWIANFIFTRCPGICPPMTRHMAKLQQELSTHTRWDDIRLVSFSVDPEYDTPQRLRAFAARYKADAEHWLFLTGQRDVIWRLCRDGFKQTVEPNEADALNQILHTSMFILVDRHNRIRGFFDSLKEEERSELKQTLERVLLEDAAPDHNDE